MMENLVIRFAKDYDVEDMAWIHAFSKKEAYTGIIDDQYLNKSVQDTEYRIEQMWSRYMKRNSMVAELNGELVGFVQWLFCGDMAELCSLYVHPSYKGQGIGTILINRVKNLCKAADCKDMQLYCLEQNYSAMQFYKKNGGIVVDKKMLEFGGKEYPAVIFVFDLKG